MKLVLVTDKGEVAIINPEQLLLQQVADGKAAVGLPTEDKKLFPLAYFEVNLTTPAKPAEEVEVTPAPEPVAKKKKAKKEPVLEMPASDIDFDQ